MRVVKCVCSALKVCCQAVSAAAFGAVYFGSQNKKTDFIVGNG
jgi:hypothetical protein